MLESPPQVITPSRTEERTTVSRELHEKIRERIVRHELVPGQRVSEAEIAAEYGVSRQPVREAFIRLSIEGLVVVRPQRGTVVRPIALASVRDARFLREAFEADIVRLLARDPDEQLVRSLRASLRAQNRMSRGDPLDFITADEAFHRLLASGAGMAGAWQRIEPLKSQMDRVRFLSLSNFPIRRLVKQHEAIVDRIAAGAVDEAELAIRIHLRAILDDLPSIIEMHPTSFELPEDGSSISLPT